MKSTKVKRGRPKNEEDFSDVVKEALKGSHDADKKEKLATPTHESTAFKNRIYHYKDGSTCGVYYSGCKDKPIDIHCK